MPVAELVLDSALLDSDDFTLVVGHLHQLEYDSGGGEILDLGSLPLTPCVLKQSDSF